MYHIAYHSVVSFLDSERPDLIRRLVRDLESHHVPSTLVNRKVHIFSCPRPEADSADRSPVHPPGSR